MKKYILSTLMIICAAVLTVTAQVKTSAQEVATPELAKQREKQKKAIIDSYLGMKNGLVISDAKKTAAAAAEFSTAIGQFKFKKLNLEQMNASTSARKSIKALADQIVAANSINDQRKVMEKLSEELWVIIDRVKPENAVVYQQKCPMMGTTWLSDSKKIENPYYPKNMLSCGEVIAEK